MATFTWNGESGDCLDPAMTLEVNAYASLAIDGHATNYGSIVAERPGFAGHYAGTGQYPMTIAKSPDRGRGGRP